MIEKIVENMLDQELDDLHTAAPARIEKYDSIRMVAEVTLMYKNREMQLSPIIEAPVSLLKAGSFIIRPPYKVGDIVLVVFSERSLDYILQEAPQDTKSRARHRLDDAIIVSGLKIDSQADLPEEHSEDLLIMNTESSSKAVLTKDGDIILEGNNIFLGDGASEGVPLGDSLKSYLDSHTHYYTWGDSGGAGYTDAPLQSAPNPSDKVKVK